MICMVIGPSAGNVYGLFRIPAQEADSGRLHKWIRWHHYESHTDRELREQDFCRREERIH